jgi:hypothetical protein
MPNGLGSTLIFPSLLFFIAKTASLLSTQPSMTFSGCLLSQLVPDIWEFHFFLLGRKEIPLLTLKKGFLLKLLVESQASFSGRQNHFD